MKAWGPAKAALDAALKRPEARQAPTEDGEGCTALIEGGCSSKNRLSKNSDFTS